ncbi:MAG: hypothetical protein IJS63_00050 [Bacteroidaceae bacterium]|nr:hypothetical protein [Bacteroidaceae bacterium]
MCQPRGLRNCNPLNIRRVAGTNWKGQCAEQTDNGFVQFESPVWGIRATFCLLRTYRNKYKAVCIEDIISRWAPPSENDTAAYIRTVCKLTGFGGKERLTEDKWPQLIKAMAIVESGWHLPEETINKGYELYKREMRN